MKTRLLSFLSAVALIASLGASAGNEVAAAPKWPIGKKLITTVTMENRADIESPGGGPARNQIMNQEQEYAVSFLKKTPEGGAMVEMETLSMKASIRMGVMTMSYDSTKAKPEDAKNPFAVLGNLVGKKLSVTLDAKGKMLKIDGLDALTKALPPHPLMKQMLSEENIRKMFGLDFFGPSWSDKTTKVGQTWTDKLFMNMGGAGSQTINATYRYIGDEKRQNRDCAAIAISGSMEMNLGAIPVKIKESKMTGKLWYARDLGLIIDSETEQKMVMEMTSPGAKQKGPSQTTLVIKVANTLQKIVDLK